MFVKTIFRSAEVESWNSESQVWLERSGVQMQRMHEKNTNGGNYGIA
jgi:hypothetical protein